jgi:hypothetical protein
LAATWHYTKHEGKIMRGRIIMRNVILAVVAILVVCAQFAQCESIETDVPPYQSKGTVMVPMRAIFQWLGAEVGFDSGTGLITAKRGEQTVSLKPGDKAATVNGEEKTMSTPAESKDGRTFVPVRFVAESFGADVTWEASTATVKIKDRERVGTMVVDRQELASQSGRPAEKGVAGRGNNKIGRVVQFLNAEDVGDEKAPRVVVVSLEDDGSIVWAACSRPLYKKLQGGGRVEIEFPKKRGEYSRVVRVVK